jgi:hypothetical protein
LRVGMHATLDLAAALSARARGDFTPEGVAANIAIGFVRAAEIPVVDAGNATIEAADVMSCIGSLLMAAGIN